MRCPSQTEKESSTQATRLAGYGPLMLASDNMYSIITAKTLIVRFNKIATLFGFVFTRYR